MRGQCRQQDRSERRDEGTEALWPHLPAHRSAHRLKGYLKGAKEHPNDTSAVPQVPIEQRVAGTTRHRGQCCRHPADVSLVFGRPPP